MDASLASSLPTAGLPPTTTCWRWERTALCVARPLGLRLPIYPLKGYSLTLPAASAAPKISITDYKRKVVYAPLAEPGGNQLRVAGMADIAGYTERIDPVRLAQLFTESRLAFPAATDYSRGPQALQPWTGLRPATPKGTPLLGATPVRQSLAQLRPWRAGLDTGAGQRTRGGRRDRRDGAQGRHAQLRRLSAAAIPR